ncbi:hypothetical protein J2797_005969 [Paraburkholderia terricola]|jgi:hypothetical protein|uniref:Uncharacterized protein n=1 Tax=Paraburkholderia terricola TaxID=169427 RepID=A0A1M6T9S1_9BURK|nr:hypothetical protein [Paraburkholderia terricola]MDR6450114.1 hypothetical protein [Paraburkholderia terricola]MDR6496044.1 hypothetical protein [Paraburkholderia terricola]SDO75226.1 hypothetical protein SAMN05192547_102643 [Paraburkholderia sediminicola]SHK53812.1 hypothetical protein SAMN05192548_102643 [Paraburkholderia terricola]
MVYAFAMLLPFAPLTTIGHTLGRTASQTKRAKFVLVNRTTQCGLPPPNQQDYRK